MALKNDVNCKLIYELMNQYEIAVDKEIPISKEETLVLENCYIKIKNVYGNKNSLTLNVCIYSSCDKTVIIDELIYTFVPSVEVNSDNFIKQGYEYLKTLPEYSTATDVLEDGQML